MLKRRIFSVIICMLFLITPLTSIALAEDEPSSKFASQNHLRYIYINYVDTILTITSGGLANVYGIVYKSVNGEEIYLYSTLQRNINGNWSNIKGWYAYSTTSSAIINEEYLVTHGEYRVETNYYVSGYDGGYDCGTVYSAVINY